LDKDFGPNCGVSTDHKFRQSHEDLIKQLRQRRYGVDAISSNGFSTICEVTTMHQHPARILPVMLAAALSACAALDAVGLRKQPDLADALKAPRTVAIKLNAAPSLNVDGNGRSLALVARIYKLKQNSAFEQAPFAAFQSPQAEKEVLGADLLEVKEVTLIPGQRLELQEKVSKEAYFLGVVALYRAPDPQRWRLSFAAADAEKSGVSIGAYGCALAVGDGAQPANVKRTPVRCPM
jgi:type VI secretion system protein VasD